MTPEEAIKRHTQNSFTCDRELITKIALQGKFDLSELPEKIKLVRGMRIPKNTVMKDYTFKSEYINSWTLEEDLMYAATHTLFQFRGWEDLVPVIIFKTFDKNDLLCISPSDELEYVIKPGSYKTKLKVLKENWMEQEDRQKIFIE